MRRRAVIGGLTAAAGAVLLPGSVAVAEGAAAPKNLPKERVLGIGGFFFRARDPKALAQWYQDHLGVFVTPHAAGDPVWTQEAGVTSFTPFPEKSGYFGDATKQWMINFRVRDLEKMAAQLEAAGVVVTVDPESSPYGRFGRLHDPEGNPVQLWSRLGKLRGWAWTFGPGCYGSGFQPLGGCGVSYLGLRPRLLCGGPLALCEWSDAGVGLTERR